MPRQKKKYPGLFPVCINRRDLIMNGLVVPHPDLTEQIQLNRETKYTDEEISIGPSVALPWMREIPTLRVY